MGQTCLCSRTIPTVNPSELQPAQRNKQKTKVLLSSRERPEGTGSKTNLKRNKKNLAVDNLRMFGLSSGDLHANLDSSEDLDQHVSKGKQLIRAQDSCLGDSG